MQKILIMQVNIRVANGTKAMQKNIINKAVGLQKRSFSKTYCFYVSAEKMKKVNEILDKLDKSTDIKENLLVERDTLKEDKELANKCRLFLVRTENNTPVTAQEIIKMKQFKDNYPSFFDQPMEESDPEEETTPQYKERKQVAQVIEYINEELNTNKSEIEKTEEQIKDATKRFHDVMVESSLPESQGESSNSRASAQTNFPMSQGESSNSGASTQTNQNFWNQYFSQFNDQARRYIDLVNAQVNQYPNTGQANQSSDQVSQSVGSNQNTSQINQNRDQVNQSSIQRNQSTNDYIDSLPHQYNPFDDVGED